MPDFHVTNTELARNGTVYLYDEAGRPIIAYEIDPYGKCWLLTKEREHKNDERGGNDGKVV